MTLEYTRFLNPDEVIIGWVTSSFLVLIFWGGPGGEKFKNDFSTALALILAIQKGTTWGGVIVFNFEKKNENHQNYDEVTRFDGIK